MRRVILLACLGAAVAVGCKDSRDLGPPLCVRSFSHDGRTDVSPLQILEFRFTTPLDYSTVDRWSFRIRRRDQGGEWVDAVGWFFFDERKRSRLFFDPTRTKWRDIRPLGFPENTEFEVVIPSCRTARRHLVSKKGSPLLTEFRATFRTTTLDRDLPPAYTRPTVVSTSPADGATCVLNDASIAVRFNSHPDPDTLDPGVNFRVFDLRSGESIAGTCRVGPDPREIVFRPADGYGVGRRTVRVVVGQSIGNKQGYSHVREHTFEFITAASGGDCRFGQIVENFDTDEFEDKSGVEGLPRAAWGWPFAVLYPGGRRAGEILKGAGYGESPVPGGPDPSRSRIPWAPTAPVRWQILIPADEIPAVRTIGELAWHFRGGLPSTFSRIRVRMGHTDLASLTTDLDANFSEPPMTVSDDSNIKFGRHLGKQATDWWFWPQFKFNGLDNLIVEIEHSGARRSGRGIRWAGGDTGQPGRTAYAVGDEEARISSWAPDLTVFGAVHRSAAHSLFYDTGVDNPRFLPASIRTPYELPADYEWGKLAFQGADDPAGPTTEWFDTLPSVSGHRYVRFRIEVRYSLEIEKILMPYEWE